MTFNPLPMIVKDTMNSPSNSFPSYNYMIESCISITMDDPVYPRLLHPKDLFLFCELFKLVPNLPFFRASLARVHRFMDNH